MLATISRGYPQENDGTIWGVQCLLEVLSVRTIGSSKIHPFRTQLKECCLYDVARIIKGLILKDHISISITNLDMVVRRKKLFIHNIQ
jgi:hypothetical protein